MWVGWCELQRWEWGGGSSGLRVGCSACAALCVGEVPCVTDAGGAGCALLGSGPTAAWTQPAPPPQAGPDGEERRCAVPPGCGAGRAHLAAAGSRGVMGAAGTTWSHAGEAGVLPCRVGLCARRTDLWLRAVGPRQERWEKRPRLFPAPSVPCPAEHGTAFEL